MSDPICQGCHSDAWGPATRLWEKATGRKVPDIVERRDEWIRVADEIEPIAVRLIRDGSVRCEKHDPADFQ